MNTKEAIEFIQKFTWTKYTDYSPEIFSKYNNLKSFSEDRNKAIALLKRGEKYENMYNKIKFIAGFNISVDEERDQVRTMLEEYVKNMEVKKIIITNMKGGK